MTTDAQKARAAGAAMAEVQAGMLVGLGTGTTAAHAIAALGRRVRQGLAVRAVATSIATARAAVAAGIAVLDFADIAAVDLCIDGVDQIDPAFRAIKGGGGALLREKIVASAAARMIAIADATKRAPILSRAVPVEILPFAQASVFAHLRALGGVPVLRAGATSDQANLLADVAFDDMTDLERLAASLSAVPGLLAHGLFLIEIDVLIVGVDEGTLQHDRPSVADASFSGTLR